MAFTLGATALGTSALATTVPRNPPTVTVDAPTGVISAPTITPAWTYNSLISRPQNHFRVVLQSGGSTLYDSGLMPGAAASYALAYVLSAYTSYRVIVGVSDGYDGGADPILFSSGWGFSDFSTGEIIDVPAVNEAVGTIYEIGINGVGYMLDDTPDRPIVRQAVHLEGERLVTGDTPFDEAIDRYSIVSHSDWTAGEGQLFLRRERSDRSRFWYSEWVNPFELGEVSLTRTPAQTIASTYTGSSVGRRAVMATDAAYLQTSDSNLTHQATPAGGETSFSTGLASPIIDLASDSEYWYATDGASIRRNNTSANPGADWSTVDVTEIAWIGDRLAGLDTAADNFTTFTPAGVEEVVGGRFIHDGASLRGICGGDGYVWYGANNLRSGRVYGWQLDSDDSSFIALTLPEGERVDSLFFYLGNVFVGSQSDRRRIYRCVPQDGRLTPQLLVEMPIGDPYRTMYSGLSRFVAFSWNDMLRTDESGIGVVDLESGGYVRWQAAGSATRSVGAVITWAGDFAFALVSSAADGGLHGIATSPVPHAGFLETSVDDLESSIVKCLIEVTLVTKPLNGTVEVSLSDDSNATYSSLGTMAGSGAIAHAIQLERQVKSMGFRLTLTPSGSAGPVLLRAAARMHPLGLADQIIAVPVRCADRLLGLNRAELPESRAGLCMEQMRTLEALVGTNATFQDIDWLDTATTYRCEVVSVQVENLFGPVDPNQGKRVNSGIAVVTLRRSVR